MLPTFVPQLLPRSLLVVKCRLIRPAVALRLTLPGTGELPTPSERPIVPFAATADRLDAPPSTRWHSTRVWSPEGAFGSGPTQEIELDAPEGIEDANTPEQVAWLSCSSGAVRASDDVSVFSRVTSMPACAASQFFTVSVTAPGTTPENCSSVDGSAAKSIS